MPEGPEVETVRLGLLPIVGHHIEKIVLSDDNKFFKGNEVEINKLLKSTITGIERRGKFLIFHFKKKSKSMHVLNHLGMTGIWYLLSKGNFSSSKLIKEQFKHFKVYFHLSNGDHLLYICVRKFGKFQMLPLETILDMKSIAKLGPDILVKPFDHEQFIKRLSTRKKEIGRALLDSSIVAGCGNIYKSEALYAARIDPFRSSSSLTKEEIITLASKLSYVAQRALKNKGSTLRDFKHVDGYSGLMQNNFDVYDRLGEQCRSCDSEIVSQKQGDRTTYYCQSCQY